MGKDKTSNETDISLNKTAKFAVLDAPGVSQPKPENEPKSSMSNKEGLQGRRAKASTGARMDDSSPSLIGGSCFEKRSSNPEWINVREEVYSKISARRDEELANKIPVEISVTMPDGNVISCKKDGERFMAWRTSPYDVAAVISQGLADAAVVARVTYENYVSDYDLSEDGMTGEDLLAEAMDQDVDESNKAVLWDMTRPLVGNVSKLEFLKFDADQDAKTVFWHSSAHMLGEALEHLYGCRLTIGPPLKGGFYYDSYMGTKDALREEDYKQVEGEVAKITKAKQKFHRLVVTKDEALELFAGNPFKEQIIKTKIPDGSRTTVYKCGDLIDLCRGPHLPHTGRVKAFAATRHSATNWLGDTDNDSLQRMYGISFPDK
jgi:threonyl-tRNA synthetase